MISTLISFNRRALRRSSLVLAGVAALAACDNDKALGPNAAVAPAEASMANASNGASFTAAATYLTWEIREGVNGANPGGSEFTVDNGRGPVTVADGSTLDLDSRPGMFKVQLRSGTTNVCAKTPPPGYVFNLVPPFTSCVAATLTPGQTRALANWYVNLEASVYWFSRLDGAPGDGSVYTITSKTGFQMTIADGDPDDMAESTMMIYVKLPAAGWYTVCQTVPPKGGLLANPACRLIEVQFGYVGWAGMFDSEKKQ